LPYNAAEKRRWNQAINIDARCAGSELSPALTLKRELMSLTQIIYALLIAVFAALILIPIIIWVIKKFDQALDRHNENKPAEAYTLPRRT